MPPAGRGWHPPSWPATHSRNTIEASRLQQPWAMAHLMPCALRPSPGPGSPPQWVTTHNSTSRRQRVGSAAQASQLAINHSVCAVRPPKRHNHHSHSSQRHRGVGGAPEAHKVLLEVLHQQLRVLDHVGGRNVGGLGVRPAGRWGAWGRRGVGGGWGKVGGGQVGCPVTAVAISNGEGGGGAMGCELRRRGRG